MEIIQNYGFNNVRRPSGQGVRVDENGDEIVAAGDVTQSKEFLEAFGSAAAAAFGSKTARNKITVIHDASTVRQVKQVEEKEEQVNENDVIEGNPIENK